MIHATVLPIKNFMRFNRLIVVVAFCLIGCTDQNKAHITYGEVKKVSALGNVPSYVMLEQNWDMATRQKFWFTSQGSRLMPYSWFTWLEQKDSEKLFRHSQHMASLGYIPQQQSALNPAGLPIGFALDVEAKTGDTWVGPTCAACHTGQIDVDEKSFIIDGGPTLGNFSLLMSEVQIAMQATLNNAEKFNRFAEKVLASNIKETTKQKTITALKKDFQAVIDFLLLYHNVNALPDNYPKDFYGHGRVDAFGVIQNAAASLALKNSSNINIPNAPVSYPFLWGAHQSDVVQWNGLLPNDNFLGPLARNAGEVIGVLGGLQIEKKSWWKRFFLASKNTYTGHINFINLGYLEMWLRDLRSPKWPEKVLPAIKQNLASQGEKLYKSHCVSCHQLIADAQQAEFYKANLIPVDTIGTDPAMAKNAVDHIAQTGILNNTKKIIYFGERLGEEMPAIDFAINGTAGLMLKEPIKVLRAAQMSRRKNLATDDNFDEINFDNLLEEEIQEYCKKYLKQYSQHRSSNNDTPYVYKARPLTGIWATAPYLHNGSVPNLTSLLRKPENRPISFWVGSRQFDSENVGYESLQGLWQFNVFERDGVTAIKGNSNKGHVYGTQLLEQEKIALLEFLKTL